MTKVCKSCGQAKGLSDFHEHRPGEHRLECKQCFNQGRNCKGKLTTAGNEPGARTRTPKVVRVEEKITAVEEHRLRRRVRELDEERRALAEQLSEGGEYNEIVREARSLGPASPSIKPRERKSGLREGTPLILASDWHIEQEVKPEAVAGRNRYNLEISKKRMQNFFEAEVWAVKQQSDTFKIRDLIH